jgi:putative transposase
MTCPHCESTATTERSDRTALGYRRFRCRDCSRVFNERTGTLFNRLQYPTDVVCLVVFWRFRYTLSLRDLAEMFLQRGITFTHEAVREWEAKLAPLLGEALRTRRHGTGGRAGMSMRHMCVFKANGSISTGPLIGTAVSWMSG